MSKSNIWDFYSHNYTKIKINLDDDLPFEKRLNVQNVVIIIKSVFNKNYNHYYYETFTQECS